MHPCDCISEHQPVGIRSITQYVLEDLMAAVHWTGVPRAHTPVVLVWLSAKSVNLCLHGGVLSLRWYSQHGSTRCPESAISHWRHSVPGGNALVKL